MTAVVHIPTGIQRNILKSDFAEISFAKGLDNSVTTCFFYAGVLAFADGMFPVKVSAIASNYHRADLPITLVTTAGAFTRWVFCFLVSTVIVN